MAELQLDRLNDSTFTAADRDSIRGWCASRLDVHVQQATGMGLARSARCSSPIRRVTSRAIMKKASIVCLGVLLAVVIGAAQKPKYGVTVTADRKTDFNVFKSYSWDTASWPALDKDVNQQIVDAVDRELKGLGLERRESGPADIQLRYGAQRRTDADLRAKAPATDLPTYVVGTLVVLMRESASGKEVYRARVDKPVDLAPDKIKMTIDEVVAEMFAKYPTRTRK
jgi:hypothetical protein